MDPPEKRQKTVRCLADQFGDMRSAIQPVLYHQCAKLCERIPPEKIDPYDKWRNLGFALANILGNCGFPLFQLVSKTNSKYDPYSCRQQYTDCLSGELEMRFLY